MSSVIISNASNGVGDSVESPLGTSTQDVLQNTHREKSSLKVFAKNKYINNVIRREKKDHQDKNCNEGLETHETFKPPPPFRLEFQSRRSLEEFQYLNKIAEGAYGAVFRVRDQKKNEVVALKQILTDNRNEGFYIAAMRELQILLKVQHPNIVAGREIVVGSNMEEVFIEMEYVPHDLRSYMDTVRKSRQLFSPCHVKCLMTQLLCAVQHLHQNWILHRDLKLRNILLSYKGVLKLADFGLARQYELPPRQYTPGIGTIWYRAPELLLLSNEYSTPIDMWSVGCIFAELITMRPLFPGTSELDQINRIFEGLGTPTDATWPGFSELPVDSTTFKKYTTGRLREKININLVSKDGLSLLQDFLLYDPARRMTADAALNHAYFKEQPLATEPARFPMWPAKSQVQLSP
ncbi:serine/threonine-protein kinase PITSLRE-like [Spodoptera litura]|uniref:Serine/threonine-protein kinase PITSLRE-like n=1 Tax=Spodoptera litura TaxID=69820 RepID=A0A9J7ENQ0_SPOLT|nr:serine/threonine-protein kinase PITSLRE-like [Spodoptera litura]